MSIETQPRPQGGADGGPNPDYKGPPVKRWHTVEVIAAVGTEFGLVEDSDVLSIITRRSGEPWPHGITPVSGMNTIASGYRLYAVKSGEQGWGIDVWQKYASYLLNFARSGEVNPLEFEPFAKRLHMQGSTQVSEKGT